MFLPMTKSGGGTAQPSQFVAKSLPYNTNTVVFELDGEIEEGYIVGSSYTYNITNSLSFAYKIENNVVSYLYANDGSSYWSCFISDNKLYIRQTDIRTTHNFYIALSIIK